MGALLLITDATTPSQSVIKSRTPMKSNYLCTRNTVTSVCPQELSNLRLLSAGFFSACHTATYFVHHALSHKHTKASEHFCPVFRWVFWPQQPQFACARELFGGLAMKTTETCDSDAGALVLNMWTTNCVAIDIALMSVHTLAGFAGWRVSLEREWQWQWQWQCGLSSCDACAFFSTRRRVWASERATASVYVYVTLL